jgi:dTDP-4-amino-4,6-dideoxygalactose transaminase
MTDVQAALGLCQLRRLEGFIQRREEICRRYDRAFGALQELVTPPVVKGVRHSRYIYPLLLNPDRLRIDRAEFIEALRAEKIGTSVHFIPVHLHPYYRDRFGYKRGDYPAAESVYDRLISLPLFPHMKDKDVDDVIAAVRRIVEYYRA